MDAVFRMLTGGADASVCRQAEALPAERWEELWQRWQAERVYCHPAGPAVQTLVRSAEGHPTGKVRWLYDWCLDNLAYGRLRSPWFPLIRTDEDVLRLGEGTCGDFAHLLVACISALGLDARYVRVDRDVYGDEQDHICAAFFAPDEGRWVMVDPTYRTAGWDVRHQAVRLITREAHWAEIRRDEFDWLRASAARKRLALAGLTYAPWVYEGVLERTDRSVRTFFVLLTVPAPGRWALWGTLHEQGAGARACPVRLRAETGSALAWDLCVATDAQVWDEARWAPQGAVTPGALAEHEALRTAVSHFEQFLPRLQPVMAAVEAPSTFA